MDFSRLILVAVAALLIAGATDVVLIAQTRWQGSRRLFVAAAIVPALIALVCLVTIGTILLNPNIGNMRGTAVGATLWRAIVSGSVAAAAGFVGAWVIERWRGR